MKECKQPSQIERYLLGELSEAQECAFEAHCRQCAVCASQVAELGHAVLEMDTPADRQSLENCFAAVQKELHTAKTIPFSRVKKRPARVARAVAASLTAACGIGLFSLSLRASSGKLDMTLNWQQSGNLVTAYSDRPIVRDGKVFALRTEHGENQLLALSKTDGSVVWKTPIGQTTRIVADEQRVFTGQFANSIFSITALSIQDGAEEWVCNHAFNGKNPRRIAFQLADGRLNWIAGKTLYSFDTTHGALVWKTRLNDEAESYAMPVSQDDRLLVAGSRNLYTLDQPTGSILRVQPYAERYNHYLKPQVASDGDRFFVSAVTGKGKGQVICYSKTSGRRLWLREMDRVKNIQSAQGLLIIKNDNLEAYDPQDGSLIWSEPIDGCYKVAFHNQNIFAIHNTDNSDIIALNAKTGRHIKSFSIGGQSCSGVLIDGQDGFLSTNTGGLIAMSF